MIKLAKISFLVIYLMIFKISSACNKQDSIVSQRLVLAFEVNSAKYVLNHWYENSHEFAMNGFWLFDTQKRTYSNPLTFLSFYAPSYVSYTDGRPRNFLNCDCDSIADEGCMMLAISNLEDTLIKLTLDTVNWTYLRHHKEEKLTKMSKFRFEKKFPMTSSFKQHYSNRVLMPILLVTVDIVAVRVNEKLYKRTLPSKKNKWLRLFHSYEIQMFDIREIKNIEILRYDEIFTF